VIGFSAGHLVNVCITESLDKENSPSPERWCRYTPRVVSDIENHSSTWLIQEACCGAVEERQERCSSSCAFHEHPRITPQRPYTVMEVLRAIPKSHHATRRLAASKVR
jgi:hypothetical protein